MKTIKLTKGLVTFVDDADYAFLSNWKWFACCCSGRFYARRDQRTGNKQYRIYMHRVISGAAPGQYPDHKDGCTLNNQRDNLRLGTQRQNMGNCGMQSHNKSGLKGVCWDSGKRRWLVQIKRSGRKSFVGRFKDKAEAARAYDSAAIEEFGRFARTNKMMGLIP